MNVYLINIKDVTKDVIEEVKQKLPSRYQKALRYKLEKDFKLSIGVSYLIIKAIPNIKDDDLSYDDNGKPYCKNIYFNVSHSGSYGVLVKGTSQIGIDIEKVDFKHLAVVNKVCNDEEIEFINNSIERFCEIWTIKESISKTTGKGLKENFKDINTLFYFEKQKILFDGNTYFVKTTTFKDKNDKYYISVTQNNDFDGIKVI